VNVVKRTIVKRDPTLFEHSKFNDVFAPTVGSMMV
jgi:hypothetical protein